MVPLQESGRKEAHDARQDEHCPGSRVTVFLLQITEQEIGIMKRPLTILTLTTLAAVALIGVVWTAPSPALAGGATQISGDARFAEVGECVDPDAESSPSGTYRETGTETFVASDGVSTFKTTYRFEAKYEDVDNLLGEQFGRCQHPIVEGSGRGDYEGVSGRLDFKDDVETGTFLYRGHLLF